MWFASMLTSESSVSVRMARRSGQTQCAQQKWDKFNLRNHRDELIQFFFLGTSCRGERIYVLDFPDLDFVRICRCWNRLRASPSQSGLIQSQVCLAKCREWILNLPFPPFSMHFRNHQLSKGLPEDMKPTPLPRTAVPHASAPSVNTLTRDSHEIINDDFRHYCSAATLNKASSSAINGFSDDENEEMYDGDYANDPHQRLII